MSTNNTGQDPLAIGNDVASGETTASPTQSTGAPTPTSGQLLAGARTQPHAPSDFPVFRRILGPVSEAFEIYLDQDGVGQLQANGEFVAHRIGSNRADQQIRTAFLEHNQVLSDYELTSINKALVAAAEAAGVVRSVWLRIAKVENGSLIDLADPDGTRVRLSPGKVEVVRTDFSTIFRRTPFMRALPLPAARGDYRLLRQFVNLDAVQFTLLVGYVTYLYANPRVDGVTFLIALFLGPQGAAKSTLSRIIQRLVDPSAIGPQAFPRSERDLAIAVQHAHLLVYDNLRSFSPAMADALCRVSSGGAFATRRLYSDGEQVVLHLHAPVSLNGLHAFIDQPDLAQRCLPFVLRPLDDSKRLDETEMLAALEAALPEILMGLWDLTASILQRLPEAQVVSPERVIAFSKWLAGLELVHGAPPGIYQDAYSEALNLGMLDALLENSLAAAILSFADDLRGRSWSGTPKALYRELCEISTHRTVYARDWPQNEIAMGKQLRSLQAGLQRQGVEVSFTRGRERSITVVCLEGAGRE